MNVFLRTYYKEFESGTFQDFPDAEAKKLIKSKMAVKYEDFNAMDVDHYPDTHPDSTYKTKVAKVQ